MQTSIAAITAEKAMEIYQLLPQDCRLFDGLSKEDFPSALAFFDAKEAFFPKGTLIQSAGEPVTRFGVLLSGALHVFAYDVEGERMLMASVTAGESYGESLCYLRAEESPVYVEATENAHLLLLSTDALRHPSACTPLDELLSCRFTAMLADKILHMNNRVQILSKRTLRKKLLAFFTQCVYQANGDREFTIPFDRAGLADYLGADRTALSRELSAMKKEGIIDFSRSRFSLSKKHNFPL